MPRINAPRVGMSNKVTIAPNGNICFPRRVMERLGWVLPMRVSVDYLIDYKLAAVPLVLFLSAENSAGGRGYTLSPLNRGVNTISGGKITCSLLTRTVIAPRIDLTRFDIEPIYPANNLADLVLMLTEPAWQSVEFTMAGCVTIGGDNATLLGTYELLAGDGMTLRVGEGNVQNRIREHLKDERLIRAVKRVRYFAISEKPDAELMEQVLLARHETRYDALPMFNSIRA